MRVLVQAAALLSGMFARLAALVVLASLGVGVAWLVGHSLHSKVTTVVSTSLQTTTAVTVETKTKLVATIPAPALSSDGSLSIETPRRGERLASGFTVAGRANVYEGALVVTLLDQSSKLITTEQATASCGSGCLGSYSVTLNYQLAENQRGTLVVTDTSAKGGKPAHRLSMPVLLSANTNPLPQLPQPTTPATTGPVTTVPVTTATTTTTSATTTAP